MKDLAGGERVGVQFNVEAAQQHYMTATEPYKLPFSFLFFTIHLGQMTVCYCSPAHWPYLYLVFRDIFPGVKHDLNVFLQAIL